MRRLIAYAEKIFRFSEDLVAPITDRRPEPRIATATVIKAATCMFWARMRSLNAWELSAPSRFWRNWLQVPMPSADTMGRVHALADPDKFRDAIHTVYSCLKRNKALPNDRGFTAAIVDGHESHASYLRHCTGCLERTVHTEQGDRVQYYLSRSEHGRSKLTHVNKGELAIVRQHCKAFRAYQQKLKQWRRVSAALLQRWQQLRQAQSQ